jgi:hypothetical protein
LSVDADAELASLALAELAEFLLAYGGADGFVAIHFEAELHYALGYARE